MQEIQVQAHYDFEEWQKMAREHDAAAQKDGDISPPRANRHERRKVAALARRRNTGARV